MGDIEQGKAVVDDVLFRLKEYRELEKLLGISPESHIQIDPMTGLSRTEMSSQGKRAAERLRNSLQLGTDAIADLRFLFNEANIALVAKSVPELGIDGFSYSSPEHGQCIFVNTASSPERQRFTMAHELGHLAMDFGHAATVLFRSGDRNAGTGTPDIELRANAFAASFLVPASGLEFALHAIGAVKNRSVTISSVTIEHVRRLYCVSYDLLCWRLVNERYITEEQREELMKYAGKDAPSSVDETSQENELRTLAFQAYGKSLISIGRLAQYLRLDLYETRKQVKEAGIRQKLPKEL